MNKVTRKHKKNWLTITVFAFLCLPRVGRLTCFSVVTRYWIPAFCRWELRSLFCVISAEKSIPNKLSPLRKSTENLNVPLNDNPCYISFESLQEASDFVHVYVLVGHAIMPVLTEFPIVRKAHLSVQTLHERLYKVWFKKLSSSLRFLSRWNRRTLSKF